MKTLKALLITENEQIQKDIQETLSPLDIEVEVGSDLKQSFEEHHLFSYFLIDESFLKENQDIHIPTSSYLIGLVQDRSFDTARSWMRYGTYDVIVTPDELDRLVSIINHTKHRLDMKQTAAGMADILGSGNQVMAFYSAKGGSGKSIVSTMVAQCLKVQDSSKKVMLIDLNAQYGGLEVFMGLEPVRSYYDLIPVIQELSIHHIQNVITKEERTGLDVLLGPSNPEQADRINDELIAKVIRNCREHYDYVILDLPSDINSLSFTGLNEATHIYYILTADSVALRSFKHALKMFDRFQLGKRDNLSLVINRMHKKNELTSKDVSNLLNLPIVGELRSDFIGIQPMINMGLPFFLKKNEKAKTKITRDVQRFVMKTLA